MTSMKPISCYNSKRMRSFLFACSPLRLGRNLMRRKFLFFGVFVVVVVVVVAVQLALRYTNDDDIYTTRGQQLFGWSLCSLLTPGWLASVWIGVVVGSGWGAALLNKQYKNDSPMLFNPLARTHSNRALSLTTLKSWAIGEDRNSIRVDDLVVVLLSASFFSFTTASSSPSSTSSSSTSSVGPNRSAVSLGSSKGGAYISLLHDSLQSTQTQWDTETWIIAPINPFWYHTKSRRRIWLGPSPKTNRVRNAGSA